MSVTADRVQFTSPTTGTGPISDGTAVDPTYVNATNGGLIDTAPYSLVILDSGNFEMCVATWSAANSNFTRVTTIRSTTGSPLSLSGAAKIFVTAFARDIGQPSFVMIYNVGSFTWTKPPGLKSLAVTLYGGGSGGGGGAMNTSGNVAGGGGGGGGGGLSSWTFPADVLPATVALTVGAGSAGGAGSSTAGGQAANANVPGFSQFGAFLKTASASQGQGGRPSGAATGSGGGGLSNSWANGGAASATGGAGVAGAAVTLTGSPAGGGAGGGISTANVASNGGNGGNDIQYFQTPASDGSQGGVTGGTTPGNASPRPVGSDNRGGFGGAGGKAVIGGTGIAGGNGSAPGGGGGGGGGSTTLGGNGGAGADGRAILVHVF